MSAKTAALERALREAFDKGVETERQRQKDERGRLLTRAREANLGRGDWREAAVQMDHELFGSGSNLSRRARAMIIAKRLALNWHTVYEGLPHDPVYGLRRPRRRPR